MSIRLKLTLFMTLKSSLLLGILGYFLVYVERSHTRARTRETLDFIQQTSQRAASDSLLQRDHLMLLSDLKFLRGMFPALAYCDVSWLEGAKKRDYHVGLRVSGGRVREQAFDVADPGEPSRRVRLALGVDYSILEGKAEEDMARLERDLLRLFGLALLAAVLFGDFFARRMTWPLAELSAAAGEIGRGRLGVHLDWESKDEIGALVHGFNAMSERLEELDAMKRDFVSAVTHELRSPLGAIESFLGLLEGKINGGRPSDPSQVANYLARIKANVRRLSGFITDLLDVAKLETGNMECALKAIRIQDVAAEVVQFFGPKAREQGLKLASRIPPDFGEVQGDPERLRQVLVNLVANAFKFTPKGGEVWVSAEQYRENGARHAEVAVFDTGRGMDEEDMDRLFKKFSQGRNVRDGVIGPKGTGLGLFIVKSIVEAHGGQVAVKSAPGKGTKMSFSLRMAG